MFASAADAESGSQSSSQFELTPYFWGAGLEGTTGVRNVQADVDVGFDDILDNLDSAFMGTIEWRRGAFGVLFDGLYFKLADEGARSWHGPNGIGSATGDLQATTTMQMYQIAGAYRLPGRAPFDIIVGARYTQIDSTLDLTVTTGGLLPGGARSVSDDESWWDPFIGTRLTIPFGEKWAAVLYGDFGGFGVGSESTYQFIAGLNWQFSKHFALKAGYRYIYQNYENDDDGFVWDMSAYGPYLGLGIRF
jgi:hypothetical protein